MKKLNISLILILLVAIAVRVYNLTSISLWHDEAFSALLINYPWKEMFYRIGLDVHPPVYYVALRLWSYVFGHSLWALRGFSMFFGVATVYATYLFVKTAFKKENVALGAALLVAISPFQIQYVTEARMYTFGTFLLMFSAYLLVKAMDSGKWKFWISFAIVTSLAMYTHYYLFFSIFAIGLFAIYYAYNKFEFAWQWYRMLGSYLLVLLLYIPWMKTFMFQFSQVQNNYWIPKINQWSVFETNFTMLAGRSPSVTAAVAHTLMILAALFTLFMIYRITKKEHTEYKWLTLLCLVVPFLGSLLLSLKQSIYLDRYFLFAALFYTVALAIFIFEISNKHLRYILFGLAIVISFYNWTKFWTGMHVSNKPGMAGAAQYLNNNVEPEDKLTIGSSFEFFNFKYYNKTGVAPLLYTPGIKSVDELPHFSGTAILTDADLIHDFNSDVKSGDKVWILWTNAFGGSKPETPKNWVQIEEKGFEDVRPYGGTWIVVTEYKVN